MRVQSARRFPSAELAEADFSGRIRGAVQTAVTNRGLGRQVGDLKAVFGFDLVFHDTYLTFGIGFEGANTPVLQNSGRHAGTENETHLIVVRDKKQKWPPECGGHTQTAYMRSEIRSHGGNSYRRDGRVQSVGDDHNREGLWSEGMSLSERDYGRLSRARRRTRRDILTEDTCRGAQEEGQEGCLLTV